MSSISPPHPTASIRSRIRSLLRTRNAPVLFASTVGEREQAHGPEANGTLPCASMSSLARIRQTVLALLTCVPLFAADNPAATINVDANANKHAIDPRVYGLAFATPAQLSDLNVPLNRWGGNNTSRYNWQQNADNRGFDWYFESIAYGSATAGAEVDAFIGNTKSAGAEPME